MRSWKDNGVIKVLVIAIIIFLVATIGFVVVSTLPHETVSYPSTFLNPVPDRSGVVDTAAAMEAVPSFVVTHISTPDPLKAVYMTSWAAGNQRFRKELFDLVDTTEINAVVIDVKDYSGRISFSIDNPEIKKIGAVERRIPDIKEFIGKLHEKGVYVIARISCFQDSFYIDIRPELAVKKGDGGIWQDYKGVKWLDAGAKPVWEYLALIGRESYAVGFDELNFDYIRYPSDGNMKDIVYSWSDGRTRQEVMLSFYKYLHEQFSKEGMMASLEFESDKTTSAASTSGIPISADLFGLTTSANDDLGIGQNLSDALLYFDFVSPMVYPSHYSRGFNGYNKPAEHPYEVVKYSMDEAIKKALTATSSPLKIRPWLQDFDLGATYTPEMVRSQIQAAYDAGLTSWMLWNAGSVYSKKALEAKK